MTTLKPVIIKQWEDSVIAYTLNSNDITWYTFVLYLFDWEVDYSINWTWAYKSVNAVITDAENWQCTFSIPSSETNAMNTWSYKCYIKVTQPWPIIKMTDPFNLIVL